MEKVRLSLNGRGHGAFHIMEENKRIAAMEVAISETDITVFHTEVAPEAEGRGLAKELLAAMVHHARKNELKVIPLCPFVHAQFKRHPDEYADIWNKTNEPSS